MPRNYHTAKADIIQAMPGTTGQLVEKSGWHHDTVARWVRRMRKTGECRIVDWRRPNRTGNFVPVYGAGPGADAVCTLKPLTNSEDWHLAKKRYGMETLRKKERARHWALKARRGETTDPLMAALFDRTTERQHENK
jgi:hypothetical protein